MLKAERLPDRYWGDRFVIRDRDEAAASRELYVAITLSEELLDATDSTFEDILALRIRCTEETIREYRKKRMR